MNQLWEDTIVTALRDAQWLRCGRRIPKSAFPSGFVKLDGNAESALGDVVYSSEERYFIFEVKALRSDIVSEWDRSDAKSPKMVYQCLANYWSRLEDLSSIIDKNEEEQRVYSKILWFFKMSLAGHHFIYWDAWKDGHGQECGEIVVESYVAACVDLFDEKKTTSPRQYLKPWPASYFGFTWGGESNRLTSEVVSLDEALDSDVKICFSQDGGLSGRRVGLTIKELQTYVNTLVGNGEEQEGIFAVVMSDTGSFYRVVGSTKHLAKIMVPSSVRISPRRSRKPQASGRRAKPSAP